MTTTQDRYKDFKFLDPGVLIDDDIQLILKETRPFDPENGFVPEYKFEMVHTRSNAVMGTIDLRVGLTDKLREFGGHIGYAVEERFRGNKYAARSCTLLMPLIHRLGINPIVITCSPGNIPSVKTIESLGGKLQITKEVEIEPQVLRKTSIYFWEV